MKASAPFAFLYAVLSFPSLSSACSCLQPTVQSALNEDNVDAVFRGRVIRQIQSTDKGKNQYLVRVWRAFKGCSFNSSATILVETGNDPAFCGGVDLEVNQRYVLSGRTRATSTTIKVVGLRTQVNHTVSFAHCDYISKYDLVSEEEKNLLFEHFNQCE